MLGSTASADGPRDPFGFEPSIHVGVGTFPSHLTFDETSAWAPGTRNAAGGVHLDLAYRFGRPVDLGLHVFHQWLVVRGVDGDSEATASGAGVLARLHPLTALWPRLPIDLSFGVGLDLFASARQTTETRTASGTTEERASIPGFAMPVWLGLDVVLGDVALGLVAIWTLWWRNEECASVGTGLPACHRVSSAPIQYLFLGAGLRVHLEFVQ